MARDVLWRLTLRYLLALATIGATAVAVYLLLLASLDVRAADGAGVNHAGRQRMLSQRIAKQALLALRDGEEGPASTALLADVRAWSRAHRGLIEGDPRLGLEPPPVPQIRRSLLRLSPDVRALEASALTLVTALREGDQAAADAAARRVVAQADEYLPAMDRVVFAVAAHAAVEQHRVRTSAGVALVTLLAVLGGLGVFVLRPAVREAAEAIGREAGARQLLRTVIDTIPDHIYVKDAEGRATLRNLASARALGFDRPEDSVGLTDQDCGVDDQGEIVLSDDLRVVMTGQPLVNKEEPSADGGWLLTTKVPLLGPDGRPTGLVGVSRDVTSLRAARAQFRALVEGSVAGTAVVQEGRVVYANPRLAEIFGVPRASMAGLLICDLLDAPPSAGDPDPVRRGLRPDGGRVYIEVGTTDATHRGRPAVVWTFIDVTSREEMERMLFHQAHHDELTGLANRALFRSRLEVAIAEATRDGAFAVLYLDLDRFKAVNDTLGHAAGDAILQAVAGRLKGAVRPGDTVARLGGDEFAVLVLDPPSPAFVDEVAQRVLQSLADPIQVGDEACQMGASIGVVASHLGHDTADTVLLEVDRAMYDAKGAGRGRVVAAASSRPSEAA